MALAHLAFQAGFAGQRNLVWLWKASNEEVRGGRHCQPAGNYLPELQVNAKVVKREPVGMDTPAILSVHSLDYVEVYSYLCW